MNSIDWSKAPEGFPLWLEDIRQADVDRSCWAREGKGEYEFPNGGFWTYSVEGFQYRVHYPPLILEQTATHAPTWNGPEDGLPPVGLEIEVLWSSTKREYVTGKVLAHDEDRAVFRFTSGGRKGEYQADKPHSQHGADLPNFRPIRTPAQIAAEEQDTAVEQMFSKFGGPQGLTRLQCRWVISEGYRKVKDYGE